jgi:hypothetical protein
MTAHLGTDGSPLVVHVIPSPLGRGAQRAARILVDQLDEPGKVRHRLLGLFDGPPEVQLDLALGIPVATTPPRASNRASPSVYVRALARLDPAAVVAHGGDPMKYVCRQSSAPDARWPTASSVPTRDHRRCSTCGAGGASWPGRIWSWRSATRCSTNAPAFRSGRPSGGRDTERTRPFAVPSPIGTGRGRGATLIFVGAMTPQKQPDRFVEVVGRLRAEGRSFRAMLVGDGPLAGTAGRCGGSPRGRAPRFPFGRARAPPPIGRAGVHQSAHRRGHAGRAHRGRTERTPGRIDTRTRGGVRAHRRPHRDHRRRLGWRDDRGGRPAPGRLRSSGRHGAAARSRCESEFTLDLMAERWRGALQSMVGAQGGAARRGRPALGRRANALRRSMRARRGSSHS